jgi:hypothetical protein
LPTGAGSPRETGPVRAPSPEPEGVVEGGPSSGSEHSARVTDAAARSRLGGLVDQGDQVVRAVRERPRDTSGTGVLGDPLGQPPEVGDQPGGERAVAGW